MEYYAIEIIGYGKRTRYCIKRVCNKCTYPTNGKSYRTEEAARSGAAELNIKIEKCGDLWSII